LTACRFELTVPSGAKLPVAHSHDAFDEAIYGLEGVLTMTLNSETVGVGPGEVLFIPRGAVHRFDNPLPATARTLAIITQAYWAPVTFGRLQRWPKPRQMDHQTPQPSPL
jgi:quercetin dioxygenase-like cupin family protein